MCANKKLTPYGEEEKAGLIVLARGLIVIHLDAISGCSKGTMTVSITQCHELTECIGNTVCTKFIVY